MKAKAMAPEAALRDRMHARASMLMYVWSVSGAGTHFPGEDTGQYLDDRQLRVTRKSAEELRVLIRNIIRWVEDAPFEKMPASDIEQSQMLQAARSNIELQSFMRAMVKQARPRRPKRPSTER